MWAKEKKNFFFLDPDTNMHPARCVSGISDLEYMPEETAGDEGLGIRDTIMQLWRKWALCERQL